MALINPSNLYSGEAERFNSQPSVTLAANLMAKRQAREDALDKYYSGLPNTINDKGVRDIDIPVIHQKVGEMQQYYMQNKAQIQQGTTPEAYYYSKMFREASAITQESINRSKTALKIGELKKNPKFAYIFNDPTLFDKIAAHEKSVTEAGTQAINFDQLTLPPEPVNYPKFIKEMGGDLKYNTGVPQVAPHPTDKNLQVETISPELGNDAKEVLKTRAIVALHNNPSFAMDVDKLQSNSTSMVQMNDVYKKAFGKPISTDPNGEFDKNELATAYTLSLLPPPQVKSRNIPNADYIRQQNEAMRKRVSSFNSRLIEGRKRAAPDGTEYNDGNLFDGTGSVEPIKFVIREGYQGLGGSSGSISDGTVLDANGIPYSGNGTIKSTDLLAETLDVLKKTGRIDWVQPTYQIVVKGGVITAIKTDKGVVDRKSMENGQLEYNKVILKKEQPNYGYDKKIPQAPTQQVPTSKPVKKDPLGIL